MIFHLLFSLYLNSAVYSSPIQNESPNSTNVSQSYYDDEPQHNGSLVLRVSSETIDRLSIVQNVEVVTCRLGVPWELEQIDWLSNYGCWCGFGGQGDPVDAIDSCCKAHDECYDTYDNTIRHQCMTAERAYIEMYQWICLFKPICSFRAPGILGMAPFANTECEKFLCDCDVDLADCLYRQSPPQEQKGCKSK